MAQTIKSFSLFQQFDNNLTTEQMWAAIFEKSMCHLPYEEKTNCSLLKFDVLFSNFRRIRTAVFLSVFQLSTWTQLKIRGHFLSEKINLKSSDNNNLQFLKNGRRTRWGINREGIEVRALVIIAQVNRKAKRIPKFERWKGGSCKEIPLLHSTAASGLLFGKPASF